MAKTTKLNFDEERKQIQDRQRALITEIKAKRAAHTRSRLSFDKATRNLQLVEGQTTMLIRDQLLQDPNALVMPGPGGTSENWFWSVLRTRLQQHPAVVEASAAVQRAQETTIMAEQEVLDLSDEWGMLHDHARLLAARMQYGASEV